ncbi:MAG: hypothetical protein AAB581_00670 [Patescibacteria group bacterium]
MSDMRGKRLGPMAQKILLLLEAGVVLGLTSRPDQYFRVLKQTSAAWRIINKESLHRGIKRLHHSQLVICERKGDGTVLLSISNLGTKKTLQYHVRDMKLPRVVRWDGSWRIVIFDIPEKLKQGRRAFSEKLRELGFYALQKSVFVFPYPCKKEMDILVEYFELQPYVRLIEAQKIDNASYLKRHFKIT